MDSQQPLSSTTPPVKPKGILKNAPPPPNSISVNHLTWDEENLAATEIGKDSLMKITEPKTPFVRYDAETDTVEGMGDIPPFTLEPRSRTPSAPNSPLPQAGDLGNMDPAQVAARTSANTSANAATNMSAESLRRSSSARPGSTSRTSSRSTSFNLPNDDPSKAKIRATSPEGMGNASKDGEIEEDEEDDPEAAAKHAAFVRARGRHYSNEAEAMKRAAQLMAEEDDEEESSAQERDTTGDEEPDSVEQEASDSPQEDVPSKPNELTSSTPPASSTMTSEEVPAPVGKLLKADSIASIYHTDVQKSIEAFTASHTRKPKLVGILATDSKPSENYAEFTRKTCDAIGVDFVLKRVGGARNAEEADEDVNGDGVELAIIEANEDVTVDGIMVYYPIFGGRQDHYLQQVVSPYKDVEGLHTKFHFNLYHNIRFIQPQSLASALSLPPSAKAENPHASEVPPPGTVKSILPCTPLGIVKCLEYMGVYNTLLSYGDRAYGKTVTVINRSEVVGRPLAALLANDGARVFSVDIDSIQEYTKRPAGATARRSYHPRHVVHPSSNTLEQCLAVSDVVISAVPAVSYKVSTATLKDGCICVNVSSEKNFEKDVREKASLYLPSVGKVTILMLLRNLMRLCQYQEILQEESRASRAAVSGV
ncbi:hypothetical protein FRB99_005675 [Tulasnella sp. 403]|nr:hypothetical protein FRB99_005675 [Tulasnella sp. 403]